jgi:hypothetical protein
MSSDFCRGDKLQRIKRVIGELCEMDRVIVVRARKIAVVHTWSTDLPFSSFAFCTITRHVLLLLTPILEGINHSSNP